MAPKNLLRHKDCKSNLSEFDDVEGHPGFDKQGTRFKRLIKDRNDHKQVEEGIKRLVLCSGKVHKTLKFDHITSSIQICAVIKLPFCRCTMSLMKNGRRLNAVMLQFAELNNFVHSHMILSRES